MNKRQRLRTSAIYDLLSRKIENHAICRIGMTCGNTDAYRSPDSTFEFWKETTQNLAG